MAPRVKLRESFPAQIEARPARHHQSPWQMFEQKATEETGPRRADNTVLSLLENYIKIGSIRTALRLTVSRPEVIRRSSPGRAHGKSAARPFGNLPAWPRRCWVRKSADCGRTAGTSSTGSVP